MWTAICAAFELVCRFILHWGFPYGSPFVPHLWMFGDFRDYGAKFTLFHSRAFYQHGMVLTYPAPTAAIFKIFLPFSTVHAHYKTPVLCFLAFIALSALVMLGFFYRALVIRGLSRRAAAFYCGGVYVLSFPLWFELHQANIEVAVWIVVSVGIWAHWTSRSWLASIFLGTAAAMKLFPFVLLGLLVARRQYRQLALAITTAVAVTVAGLWLVCPDIAYSWQQTRAAVASLHDERMLGMPAIVSGFDHTLWAIIKRFIPHATSTAQRDHLLSIYFAIIAVAGLSLFFFRIIKLPIVNQILCLSIVSILFSPVSYDYTLLHLYAPFALITFVALQQRDKPSRSLQVALALFAFILSFQQEFILHGDRFAGSLKALALLALFILSARHPFALEPLTIRRSPTPQDSVAT